MAVPTQFKSQKPFYDISTDTNVVRSYFGSSHGKGYPSDGCSAVVKQAAYRAVKGEDTVIDNAFSLYKFLEENLTMEDSPSYT